MTATFTEQEEKCASGGRLCVTQQVLEAGRWLRRILRYEGEENEDLQQRAYADAPQCVDSAQSSHRYHHYSIAVTFCTFSAEAVP